MQFNKWVISNAALMAIASALGALRIVLSVG